MIVVRGSWFTWRGLSFDVSDVHVYPPKPASLLLAETAIETVRPGERVLDACTGSGVVAIALAKEAPGISVAATDISPTAVAVARSNADRNEVRLDVRLGDLYAPFRSELFDVIVVHPPAVPYAEGEDWGLSAGMRLATEGGRDGSIMVLRAVREAGSHLRGGGRLLLLLPHWSNHRKAHEALAQEFGGFERLAERQVEFFPATEGSPTAGMREHAARLNEAGVIELGFVDGRLVSRVSVIQAVKK